MGEIITDEERSLFQAIADTGIHKSLKAISKLSQSEWYAFPRSINLLTAEELRASLASKTAVEIGGATVLKGDIPLTLLYVFPRESALNLTHCMARQFHGIGSDIGGLQELAVTEISNILANAFLGVIANTLDVTFLPSVPGVRQAEKKKLVENTLTGADYALTGEFRLESEQLPMSCEFFILLSSASLKKLVAKAPSEPSAGASAGIMLADDSPLMRNILRIMVEKCGKKVVAEADNVDSTIQLYFKTKPELLILDVLFPGELGISALKAILEKDPDAKIMIITAVSQEEMDKELLLMGASSILHKPFGLPEFSNAILQVLKK